MYIKWFSRALTPLRNLKQTDGQTERQKHRTDFITSTADAGGKYNSLATGTVHQQLIEHGRTQSTRNNVMTF